MDQEKNNMLYISNYRLSADMNSFCLTSIFEASLPIY